MSDDAAPAAPPRDERSELGRKVVRGTAWTGLGNLLAQGLRFVQTLVLARLLAPEDFGLVGMVGLFFGLISILGEFGIPTTVIQRKDLEDEDLNALFWAGCLVGIPGLVLAAGSAPVVAWFYGEPRLVELGLAASLGFLVGGPAMVPNGLLTRDMRFARLVACDLVFGLFMIVCSVTLARLGFGPWALVISGVAGGVVRSASLILAAGYRPGRPGGLQRLGSMLSFGGAVTATALLQYATRSLDTVIVGSLLGADALGLYILAYNLVAYPETRLAMLLNRVLMPAYSKLQDDPERLADTALFACETVLLVTAPMVLGLAAVAEAFVPVVLAPRWAPMIPTLQVLCLAGPALAAVATLQTPVVAAGRAGLTARLAGFGFAVAAVSMPLGAWSAGLPGVAAAVVFTQVLSLGFAAWAAREAFRLSPWKLAGRGLAALALAGGMALLVREVGGTWTAGWDPVARLAGQVGLGVVAYTAAVVLLRRTWLRRLLALLRRAAARRPVVEVAPDEAVGQPSSE